MSVAKMTADDIRALVGFVKEEYERGEAEDQRKQNEVERQQAESQRRSNEDLRILAESQRVANEADRQTAENARASAESSRMIEEAKRVNAENLRVSAEQDRVSAENIRIAAESDRNDAEFNRSVAEQERQDAEAQRVSNEQAREQAEQLREQAEADRVNAESERVSQEAVRVSAETARANAESDRVSAEEDRATAEQARQAAEVIREQVKDDAIAATQAALSATQDAVDAASDARDAASNATSAAQSANTAADRANTEAEKIENLVHKGEYNSGALYLMNNEVRYNGSTWRALQDTQGNTPQEGPYWTLVAQRGLDGQGAVQSVAGKQPDLDGNVPLVAADISFSPPSGMTSTDTQNAIVEVFQFGNERKQGLVDALIAIGVPASINESWDELLTKTESVIRATGDAGPGDVREGKEFSNATANGIQGNLPVRTGGEVDPGPSDITKQAGIYDDPITIKGVSVPAEKVLEGVTIAGTQGSMPNRSGTTDALDAEAQLHNLYIKPAEGYYDGDDDRIRVFDSAINPDNFVEGVNFLGLIGTRPPRRYYSGIPQVPPTKRTYYDNTNSARELYFVVLNIPSGTFKSGPSIAIAISLFNPNYFTIWVNPSLTAIGQDPSRDYSCLAISSLQGGSPSGYWLQNTGITVSASTVQIPLMQESSHPGSGSNFMVYAWE